MGGPASNGYACDVATRVLTADDECKEGMADWLGSGAILCPVEYE